MAKKAFKKRIGELLVESGIITPEQLQIALQRQTETGDRLGSVLISLGMISEEDLRLIIAKKLQVPVVDLSDMVIQREVAGLISPEMARKHLALPIFRIGNVLTVAMQDPLDFIALDELSYHTRLEINRVIASKAQIESAIESCYSIGEAVGKVVEGMKEETAAINMEEISADIEDNISSDMPVVKIVNMIIARGVATRASDMHLDPDDSGLRIRFRIDGLMKEVAVLPRSVASGVISRVKVMSNMDVSERRLPQDGRFQARLKKTLVDFRVSSLPTSFGEKIAVRILDKTGLILDLKKMGFSETNLKIYMELITRPEGLILITGPTGCGKTSTLYATLAQINTPDKSIVTVEDPIEYNLPLITQVQINEKAGLSFATSLRSIVRQNPDILMVGEIRDLATAEIAVRASMTGHLVLSTLHTSDAPVALNRLIDMGIEPYLVSSAVSAVLAQRLVRTLCRNCLKEIPNLDPIKRGIMEKHGLPPRVFEAKGCPRCFFQGYLGRTSIHELLLMNPQLKDLVNHKVPHSRLRQEAIKAGLISLRADGLAKVAEGKTTIEEVMRVSSDDELMPAGTIQHQESLSGYEI